jgi:long-subunit fatty acid transport protein
MEFYGFGARKMGRGGGGVAVQEGPESVLLNPAALPGSRFPELSIGFVGVDAQFEQFPDVWWDTNRDGLVNEDDPPLDIGPQYDSVAGFMLGAVRPIGPTFAMGIGLFLPLQRLIRLQTFEPSLPSYFLYANRAQRYELGLAAGWRPKWGLAVGAGLQMIPRARYSLNATLDLTVTGAEEGDQAGDVLATGIDVHTMELDLIAGFAPSFSLHWDAGEATPALDGLQLGATWRGEAGLPVDVNLDLQINAHGEEFGDIDDIVLPLVFDVGVGVFDHYVPSRLDLGAAYTVARTLTVTADVRRTAWDRMEVSIAKVTDATIEGAAVSLDAADVEDGNPYDFQLRATWAPRAGLELRLPGFRAVPRWGEIHITTRGGFGFEPSPLVSQSEQTALLDADRSIFALGLGFEHEDPFRKAGVHRLGRLDTFFQYHVLARGELARPEPDEPTPGYAVDGSPIPIGGHLLAAGLSWSFEY